MKSKTIQNRKSDHLALMKRALVTSLEVDRAFNYEPFLSPHPDKVCFPPIPFLGKNLRAPFWISSMTGGTKTARTINERLARAASEFGLGMGLGSCRPLLDSKKCLKDFALRKIIGDELPFFANLGVAQVEKFLEEKNEEKILEIVSLLQADGLIIHVNPLQEWLQPEGDRLRRAPLETIAELLSKLKIKIVVKEVGQGFGPASLRELMKLDLAAIEFSAFGGTNFSKLELIRHKGSTRSKALEGIQFVGHTAGEMIDHVKLLLGELKGSVRCRDFILSGGVENFLEAHDLMQRFERPCVIGQARVLLEHAQKSYADLREFLAAEIEGLQFAQAYLKLKR